MGSFLSGWISSLCGAGVRTLRPVRRRLYCESLQARIVMTLPTGYEQTAVATGLINATAMEFAPDGKLYVAEQAGTLEVWNNGVRLQADFFQNTPLVLSTNGERGLLGFAFDPNFATNHYVYAYYTTTDADFHNRVSRFTANATGDLALAGSEQVLLELDPHSVYYHNGGAIHFGPDGKLYIATGDDGGQDNGGSSVWNSQRLDTLHGKILRINVDGSIPADNPFVAQTTGEDQAIWAVGLRNPYTFTFQRTTGRMFINDVGAHAFEEINEGAAGRNYGWRDTEGTFNPATYPNFTNPLYVYPHGYPSGNAITGGVFYSPAKNQFPTSLVGQYFFADYVEAYIKIFNPATKSITPFTTSVGRPVDLRVDALGNLYYLQHLPGAGGNVFKVSYTVQNRAPVLDTTLNPIYSDYEDAAAPVGATGAAVSVLVDFKTPAGQFDNVTDADPGAVLGVAITQADTTHGTWYVSTNNGSTWGLLGTVSNTQARLLPANGTARLYFRPNANYNGTIEPGLTFRAWDRTAGANVADTTVNGGSTAFSSATAHLVVQIAARNDAPTLNAAQSPTLSNVGKNASAPVGAVGTLVSQLVSFSNNVTDPDAGAKLGIAVIGANTANGRWFYSLNNGSTWTLLGTVTDDAARLLAADARLFFQPSTGFTGTIAAALTFRAWDQTGGRNGTLNKASVNGGTTTFSKAGDRASITVT
jgi:glucose/arabinose dehydrogenase